MPLIRASIISFLGVGTPASLPFLITIPHNASTSVFLPAMRSWSIETRFPEVARTTSLRNDSGSKSPRSAPEASWPPMTAPTALVPQPERRS